MTDPTDFDADETARLVELLITSAAGLLGEDLAHHDAESCLRIRRQCADRLQELCSTPDELGRMSAFAVFLLDPDRLAIARESIASRMRALAVSVCEHPRLQPDGRCRYCSTAVRVLAS